MSGFNRHLPGVYDLTTTKALHWHRSREGCPCATLDDVVEQHLEHAGFTRHPAPSAALARLSGPGLAEHSSTPLYEAVSGLESIFRDDRAPWDPPPP